MRTSSLLLIAMLIVAQGTQSAEPVPAPDLDVAAPPVLEEGMVFTEEEPLALPRNWVSVEYLLFWIRPDNAPIPLLTTGPTGVPRRGALGSPGTQVLIGNELDYESNSGFRLALGHWFGTEQRFGFEARGFMLETHTIHGKTDSDATGSPLTARPFYNVLTGLQSSQLITSPGTLIGGTDVFADSRLWGADAALLANLAQGERLRFDFLAGFAYVGQKDELRFSTGTQQLVGGQIFFQGAPVPDAAILSMRDFYRTVNQFYGGEVGGKARWQRGRVVVDSALRLGLGGTRQEALLEGRTQLTNSAAVTLYSPGGLYTQPTNLGYYTRTQVSFLTELDVRLGLQLARWLEASVGYSFLYWSDVARPGSLVNPQVDPRQAASRPNFGMPGTATQPTFNFNSSDFWAQGLTAGLIVRY